MERLSKRQIAEVGVAGIMALSAVGACDMGPKPSSPALATGTEKPQACATVQPTPIESPTPYAVNFTELDNLENQAINEIESKFNIRIDEEPYTQWPEKSYLFAFDPNAKTTLEKSLASFPDDFYSIPDGNGRIVLVLAGISGNESRMYGDEVVEIPAADLTGYAAVGSTILPYEYANWDLAYLLAQNKDNIHGNQATKQIVDILGGEKFVKNPASLYQRFAPTGIAEAGDPADLAFPKKADGTIDTSKLVGALSQYYVLDNEAEFVDDIGSIVSPGVSIGDKDYASSRVNQLYSALETLFDGKTYSSKDTQTK